MFSLKMSGRQPLSGINCWDVGCLLFTCLQTCSGKIWLTLIRGSLMNHSTVVFLVVQLINYFITLETVCRVELPTYTHTLSMLFMPCPGNFSLSSQKHGVQWSEMHDKQTENLTKVIRKKSQSLVITDNRAEDIVIYTSLLRCYNSHLPEFCSCFLQVRVEFVKNMTSWKLCLLFILKPLLP